MIIMLYNNLKALSELKKKGRKVGKLRYKKYGKLKRIQYGAVLSDLCKRKNKENVK